MDRETIKDLIGRLDTALAELEAIKADVAAERVTDTGRTRVLENEIASVRQRLIEASGEAVKA